MLNKAINLVDSLQSAQHSHEELTETKEWQQTKLISPIRSTSTFSQDKRQIDLSYVIFIVKMCFCVFN